jgi:uncharacterized protein (UPF0332 family)
MAVSQKDFRDFSNNRETCSEFNRRNRISRAYYAAYHAANAFYEDENDIDTQNGHADLILSLKRSNSKDKNFMGYKLASLKTHRVHSDYYLNESVSKADLKNVLIQTDEIFDFFGNNY